MGRQRKWRDEVVNLNEACSLPRLAKFGGEEKRGILARIQKEDGSLKMRKTKEIHLFKLRV